VVVVAHVAPPHHPLTPSRPLCLFAIEQSYGLNIIDYYADSVA
jgi:hypothetical protein